MIRTGQTNRPGKWLTAYIDESGNHDLETTKSGASNLFVCVAVIVDSNQNHLVDQKMRSISSDFFSGSEVKSSNIRSKHRRRLEILKEIKNLSFGYYALVIDKGQIEKDSGLKYKPVFYKFLNNMLYNRLLRSGTNLHIVADEIGGKAFMDSFLPYLKRKGKPDLFTDYDHRFASSAATPQIQLADLIAGTLTWCFDESKTSSHKRVFRDLLKPKETGIASWPLRHHGIPGISEEDASHEWDETIHECSINRAYNFIQEYDDESGEKRRMQVAVLRHLIFLREFEDELSPGAIISDQLIRYLKKEGFDELSRQQLSSQVIGPLRDWGILISGSSDGYRLVCTVADIDRYLFHNSSIMGPMISRLKIAREAIRHDTSNQYDILVSEEFSFLKIIVESASEKDVEMAIRTGKEDGAEFDFHYDSLADLNVEKAYVAEERR